MARETKFGLLFVLVLTSTFGLLVYKRLHQPLPLMAKAEAELTEDEADTANPQPLLGAPSETSPLSEKQEATPLTPATAEVKTARPSDARFSLAADSKATQPVAIAQASVSADPFADPVLQRPESARIEAVAQTPTSDPFAPDDFAPPTPKKVTPQLPLDLDTDNFETTTPATTSVSNVTAQPAARAFDSPPAPTASEAAMASESDPFAAPIDTTPNQTAEMAVQSSASSPKSTSFDPFDEPANVKLTTPVESPTGTAAAMGVTNSPTNKAAAAESDPFDDGSGFLPPNQPNPGLGTDDADPFATEPVATPMLSSAATSEPLATAPAMTAPAMTAPAMTAPVVTAPVVTNAASPSAADETDPFATAEAPRSAQSMPAAPQISPSLGAAEPASAGITGTVEFDPFEPPDSAPPKTAPPAEATFDPFGSREQVSDSKPASSPALPTTIEDSAPGQSELDAVPPAVPAASKMAADFDQFEASQEPSTNARAVETLPTLSAEELGGFRPIPAAELQASGSTTVGAGQLNPVNSSTATGPSGGQSTTMLPGLTAASTGPSGDVYVVQPSDSFWTISKRVYGTGRYFQALAKHNSATVGDPLKVQPGMHVMTPPAAELEQRYRADVPLADSASVRKLRADHPERFQPDSEPGFFIDASGQPMYRVGGNDTLSQISQQHLGRSSRWIQIFEMNREILKDGNTLSIGTVLKLPPDASQVQMVGFEGSGR